MNKIKLLLALIALPFLLIAQTDKDTFVVELHVEEAMTDVSFSCLRVVDKRSDTSNIGFVHKGGFDRKIPAQFPDTFTSYIKEQSNRLLGNKEYEESLVFIFHTLKINEKRLSTGEKQASIYLEIELARAKNDSLYSLGIYESRLDDQQVLSKKSYAKKIILALRNCLSAFNDTNWEQNQGKLIDLDAVKYTYDYLSVPPNGVYLSFGQMARHEPLSEQQVTMTKVRDTGKYGKYYCKLETGELSEYVQFTSDGESIYLHAGILLGLRRFVKAKHMGRYIYFETMQSNSNGALIGTVFGGLIGGGIGALASRRPIQFILDTQANEIRIFNRYVLRELTKDDYPEILETYSNSKRKIKDLEAAFIELNMQYENVKVEEY